MWRISYGIQYRNRFCGMGGNGYDYRFCGILHLFLRCSEITDVTGLRKYFLYCSQPINHIGAAGSIKTVTEKAGRYLPFPKIPRKAPTKMAGAFSNARWSALRPMGPAYGRDPRDAWRRSRCSSLATLPWVAFRPPPLTPAPPAERLRSMASRGRHRSAVRRAGPLAPGRRAPSCDAPHGSRLLGVGSTGAHLPGLASPWQPARSVQARYGFRCTESSCRLRRGRTAFKSLSPKRPERLLRPGPSA